MPGFLERSCFRIPLLDNFFCNFFSYQDVEVMARRYSGCENVYFGLADQMILG